MTLTKEDLKSIGQIVRESEDRTSKVIDAKIDNAIEELALQIGAGFNEVSDRLGRVESDVSVLKEDVSILKEDVSVLKTDMREVKWHLTETVTRSEFHGLRYRVELLEADRAIA